MFKLNFISKSSFLKNLKNIEKNDAVFIAVVIVGTLIAGSLIFINSNSGFAFPNIFGASNAQIGKDAIDFINDNQLSNTPATLVSVSEESGLVKIKIKLDTGEFDSYATKDGKLLFPQAIDMSQKKNPDTAVPGANTSPE